jgi:hypothetical protein
MVIPLEALYVRKNFIFAAKREHYMPAQTFDAVHHMAPGDLPAGGSFKATGIDIKWQDGPLGTGVARKEPTGAFVETVIEAAINRLEFYQESKFACVENADALFLLSKALKHLDSRTKKREDRGVEGTHQI